MPDPMTTPQSLTEEDLRLLESLPISLKELNEDDTDERIRPLHLLTRRGWIKYGGMEGAWGFHFTRTRLADDLLATLQAERERGDKLRESMQGTADDLDRFVGVLGEDSPLAYHVLIARQRLLNALHLDEHGSYVTVEFLDLAEATALSPDVLGDQKDKGKATDYADSKESGSVTNEGQVGSPEAAGKLTFTMHKANAEALAEAGRDLAAIWRWVTGTYTVNADLITGGVEAITEVLGGDSELCQPMSDEVIAQIRERLFGLPENEPATSLSRPDAVSGPKNQTPGTPKVEDSVVEVGGGLGECDACHKEVPVDELTASDYESNGVADGDFCDACRNYDGIGPSGHDRHEEVRGER